MESDDYTLFGFIILTQSQIDAYIKFFEEAKTKEFTYYTADEFRFTKKELINTIQKSKTYKAGLIVTWLPRKIAGFFRCIKDNGMGYTCNRFLVHLHLKKEEKEDTKSRPYEVWVSPPREKR